ncbi:secreted protein [Melampsora americana]|nr:secreted protein [Melampsora americana]
MIIISSYTLLIFLLYLTTFSSSLVIPLRSNLIPRSLNDNQNSLKTLKDIRALDEDEKELARIQGLIDDEIWDKWSYAHMIHGSGSRATEVLSISNVA